MDWVWTRVAPFAVGYALWPLLEYAIHGWLSHTFDTFVSPLHWQHHRFPHRVFTSPLAWVPSVAILYGLLALTVGGPPASTATMGVLAGFLHYEYVHWRIHFRLPTTPRQRLLRAHHLAHHFCNPNAYHGVTTTFWDRVFATRPADHATDYAAVADRPPIDGKSNLGALWPPRQAG